MTRLTGKIAIVSGAANGPTARIAARLAAEGAAVVLNDATDSEGAVRVAAGIVRRGGRAIAVQGDVSKAQDVRRIFRATVEIFGTPDIVVNNAGIFRAEPVDASDDAGRAFAVNVFGTFLMCQEAARQFNGRGGIIINMSSPEHCAATPDEETQSTIKGAIDMLTLGLAKDFVDQGIRVVSIDPARFDMLDLSDDDLPAPSARHLSGLLHHRARLPGSRAISRSGDVAFIRNELVASTGWRGW
ncbi:MULTISPECIES: SDR family NAD(P)-dependent oxidoreductase [unclassified Rhizobium]|uniref:SDR family NAD(P)-dependent oxidoreductase n=1 Tax=unclassified Rhizobium TaxID=2613769 RepID=UPI000715F1C0|nr:MULTISPECIES: SDR family NAD(P)-dependent oxidoreductase [unclassified Rhizobium]KQS90426.1 hypothetical protein ASG50_08250 [Rhizobium sp. Leaf386]KQS90669.1 hypothetical protein ASG42_09030 [Rhizobium sp. Leaf391]KQU10167.1 hypothetical protein ASG68_04120 [Rhizobium sp. Leaf453]